MPISLGSGLGCSLGVGSSSAGQGKFSVVSSAPTLTAVNITDTTVDLDWTPVTAVVTEVGRDGTDSFGGGPFNGVPGDLPFQFLLPSTTYTLHAIVDGVLLSVVVTTAATPGGGGGAGFGETVMAAPAGFTTANRVFQDTFSGTSLNLTKWMIGEGADGGLWNNRGVLGYDPTGYAYCGPNTSGGVSQSNGSELFASSQIVVNNGLTITAKPNTAPINPGGIHYPAISGCLTTFNQPGSSNGVPPPSTANFLLPSTGKWYVQARCRMPDMNAGIGPNLFFMPGRGGGNSNEMDFIQGAFGIQRTSDPALINNYPFAQGYFVGGGTASGSTAIPNVGVNTTLAFHTYGCEVNWSTRTIRQFFDGTQIYSYTAPTLYAQNYELILNIECWKPGLGWVTGYVGGTGAFRVAEVQAYAA